MKWCHSPAFPQPALTYCYLGLWFLHAFSQSAFWQHSGNGPELVGSEVSVSCVTWAAIVRTIATVFTIQRDLNPLCTKKPTMCCDYCNMLLETLQWYKMVGLREALSLSISETKTWCLLLMSQTGEIFSAIRLHCWCWRCLNLTSCHLYRASYLWRIRKLHHQTRKWTQKCKVHSQQLFSCVFLSSFCFNSQGTQRASKLNPVCALEAVQIAHPGTCEESSSSIALTLLCLLKLRIYRTTF